MTTIGFQADADQYCVPCSEKKYGREALEDYSESWDSEGNPITKLYSIDVQLGATCGACLEFLE